MNNTGPIQIIHTNRSVGQSIGLFAAECGIIFGCLILLVCCCSSSGKKKNKMTQRNFDVVKYNLIGKEDVTYFEELTGEKIRSKPQTTENVNVYDDNDSVSTVLHYHFNGMADLVKSNVKDDNSVYENLGLFVNMVIKNYDPTKIIICLQITSPGGVAYKFESAYANLLRLKQKGFKTIALVDSICASGGYMLACACTKIVVSKHSTIGSIGVISTIPNGSKLLNKVGIDVKTFTTGRYKDPFPTMEPYTHDNVEMMNEMLNEMFVKFKNIVSNARNIPDDKKDVVFAAKVFTGEDAQKHGLVDDIYDIDDYMLELSAKYNTYMIVPIEEKKNMLTELLNIKHITKLFSMIYNNKDMLTELESIKYA